jgi:hypothetical protein
MGANMTEDCITFVVEQYGIRSQEQSMPVSVWNSDHLNPWYYIRKVLPAEPRRVKNHDITLTCTQDGITESLTLPIHEAPSIVGRMNSFLSKAKERT